MNKKVKEKSSAFLNTVFISRILRTFIFIKRQNRTKEKRPI